MNLKWLIIAILIIIIIVLILINLNPDIITNLGGEIPRGGSPYPSIGPGGIN